MSDLYIKAVAPSVSRSTATLMKTGQTTSYRTGDDGDIEAGRATSFTVLAENNPFGNTNRFTDELGGSTYTNNWVIDWSTYNGSNVLGYFRTIQPAAIWNTAVTNSLGTFGTFSNCRLTNIRELLNLCNFQNILYNDYINYSPFNITGSLWSSTAVSSYGGLYSQQLQSTSMSFAGNSTLTPYIPCRTFTVTGTILS